MNHLVGWLFMSCKCIISGVSPYCSLNKHLAPQCHAQPWRSRSACYSSFCCRVNDPRFLVVKVTDSPQCCLKRCSFGNRKEADKDTMTLGRPKISDISKSPKNRITWWLSWKHRVSSVVSLSIQFFSR